MNFNNKLAAFICLFLGLLALIVGATSLVNRRNYLPVDATIIRIEEAYDTAEERYNYITIVKYRVNGKEYEGDIGFYEPGFKEGKVIEIRYDPNDPANVESATPGALIYFIVVGTMVTAAGIYLLFRRQ